MDPNPSLESKSAIDPTPLKKARTLNRVAEIVMVLAGMAEIRAGKEASAVEKALAAEARERLAAICEAELKPKDLVPREAVRALVEDFGLNRRDPMMGYRPTKVSISEKVALTKRKMEESKNFSSPPSSFPPSHPSMHGTHNFHQDRHNLMTYSAGGFQNVSPGIHVQSITSITPSSKQTLVNETSPASNLIKDSPLSAQQHAAAPHLRYDGRLNGSPYLPQTQASAEKAQSTSPSVAIPSQPNMNRAQAKSDASPAINNVQNQAVRNQDTATPDANQPTQGTPFVQGPSFFTNHDDISKRVQKVLQPKVFDHPNWNPPSADYTNQPLNCQICKISISDTESLLVCDACERGTHLKCLQSFGNKEGIPKAEWHCPRCLLASNGKPFPPKYGRVTRTIAPPKLPSEKKPENLALKVNQQKPVVNISTSINSSELTRDSKTTNIVDIKSGTKKENELATVTSTKNSTEQAGVLSTLVAKVESSDKDTPTKNSTEQAKICAAHSVKAEISDKEMSTDNSTEQAEICTTPITKAKICDKEMSTINSTEQAAICTTPSAEAKSSDKNMPTNNSTEHTEICATPTAKVEGSDKDKSTNITTEQAGGICTTPTTKVESPDKDPKHSGLFSSDMERSTLEPVLDQKVNSEQPTHANQQNTNVEFAAQSQAYSELKEIKVPTRIEVATNENNENIGICSDKLKELSKIQGDSRHQTACDIWLNDQDSSHEVPYRDNESRKPLKLKEVCDNMMLDSRDKSEAIPSGTVEKDCHLDCSKPLVSESIVHWVGDSLKVEEEKTYYQSFQIDGVSYKLQDHVMVSSSCQTVLPSKLQTLWEDNKTGLKWATVNQYCIPNDFLEVTSRPSTSEDNEVYASDKEITVLANSIRCPCEVLYMQKYTEGIDRRTKLKDANSDSHPVFICRWKFDESKGYFRPVTL